MSRGGVRVADPLRAAADTDLPWLKAALDPNEIERLVAPLVDVACGERAVAREARVVRHRRGRRCVLTYDFELPGQPRRRVRIYAKVRRRGADSRTQKLLGELRRRGLRPGSASGVAVPEPVGTIPQLHMTLQRKAAGLPATDLVDAQGGVDLVRRVAAALHTLHASGTPARRWHDMHDELKILRERCDATAALRPELETRLGALMLRCERLGASLHRPGRKTGIHRDFYPDQVLVDGDALTLLDFDLFATGDPALDVGNFAGHLVEHALRLHGDPDALNDRVDAFFETYCGLAPDVAREDVEGWATLTLARLVQVSTRVPGREHTTDDLVALCEARLAS